MYKLVVPDFVSPSYFPAIAAHQLGYFGEEGVEVDLSLSFPVTDAAVALREGGVDFLAGAAHAPMYAFDGWRGATVLVAMSQHMYWFLVMRADLGIERGDLGSVAGLTIGAAPGPADGLRVALSDAGISLDDVSITPVPGSTTHGTSFGLAAADALARGVIDGFWANGMGAEVAVQDGTGTVVYDARRDLELPDARLLTFPAVTTRTALVHSDPSAAEAVVRGIRRAQRDLAADPELATKVGAEVFPAREAALIGRLIARDAMFYQPDVTPEMAAGVARLGRLTGYQVAERPGDIVCDAMRPLWA